jgi:hypothetical protein
MVSAKAKSVVEHRVVDIKASWAPCALSLRLRRSRVVSPAAVSRESSV